MDRKTSFTRLKNLERALRDAAERELKFHMGAWSYITADSKDAAGHPCGTPACALGHYAARSDLQDDFELKHRMNGIYLTEFGEKQIKYEGVQRSRDGFIDCPFQAAVRHFGITREEASNLFSSSGCGEATTPTEAADFINGFILEKYPEFLQLDTSVMDKVEHGKYEVID